MHKRRPRIKHTRSLVERLTTHAECMRAKAASLPLGTERNVVLEKLERAERAVKFSRWLSSADAGNLKLNL
jgi:hypothetical protein